MRLEEAVLAAVEGATITHPLTGECHMTDRYHTGRPRLEAVRGLGGPVDIEPGLLDDRWAIERPALGWDIQEAD